MFPQARNNPSAFPSNKKGQKHPAQKPQQKPQQKSQHSVVKYKNVQQGAKKSDTQTGFSSEEEFAAHFLGSDAEFKSFCLEWLKSHSEKFGEVKCADAKNNLVFVQRGNAGVREFHIQLLNKENVSARAVEKAAEYLDAIIEESSDCDIRHRAVLMTPGKFSMDAQKAAVNANVLLIGARTLMKKERK